MTPAHRPLRRPPWLSTPATRQQHSWTCCECISWTSALTCAGEPRPCRARLECCVRRPSPQPRCGRKTWAVNETPGQRSHVLVSVTAHGTL